MRIGLGIGLNNTLFKEGGGGGNVAPSNVTAPVISGSTSLGSVLSTTNGTWSGTPATFSYTYQWKRNGSPILGATASTYTTVVADSTANITCDVTADNGVAPTATEGSNTLTMANYTPANTEPPAVTGTAVVGQTLSTTNGTWTNSPSTFSYQWRRNGVDIGGATASTYTLVSADAGANIICRVTASNGLSASADSNTVAILATLLDLYPNAAAAYSVRLLRGAHYTSSAIRVRRSNDNAEQDIGFTAGGDLDTTALTTFVGSNNGFITTWYDQSGNARNAANTTPLNQPQIVNSGAIITQGARPIITFLTSDFLRTSSTFSMGINRTYMLTLFNNVNSASTYKSYLTHNTTNYTNNNINGIMGRFGTSNVPASYVANGSTNNSVGNTALTNGQYYLLGSMIQGSVQHQNYRNGTLNDQNTSLAISPESTARNLDILFVATSGLDLRTNEAIVWETYQSSNRTAIELNINTYYAIY